MGAYQPQVLKQKYFYSPVPKSPTKIGFSGVKKVEKISHMGTFPFIQCQQPYVLREVLQAMRAWGNK
jgi:hypothetical protein